MIEKRDDITVEGLEVTLVNPEDTSEHETFTFQVEFTGVTYEKPSLDSPGGISYEDYRVGFEPKDFAKIFDLLYVKGWSVDNSEVSFNEEVNRVVQEAWYRQFC